MLIVHVYMVMTWQGAVLDKGFPYLKKAPCISSVGGTSWVKVRTCKYMLLLTCACA